MVAPVSTVADLVAFAPSDSRFSISNFKNHRRRHIYRKRQFRFCIDTYHNIFSFFKSGESNIFLFKDICSKVSVFIKWKSSPSDINIEFMFSTLLLQFYVRQKMYCLIPFPFVKLLSLVLTKAGLFLV
jgi:hypothetical protein